ncbi:hypothetical protein BKA62DRAFT_683590 [Auriculariales sp. MPI-PUGE-AT-0066]|nr:hypothetical protein BKA62DRAFT_683590 [Auriculariales sp. MPI-PUGE-AT-0066]
MLALAVRTARVRAAGQLRSIASVRIPEIPADPRDAEPEAKVPFVFDFWDSKEKRAADAAAKAADLDLPELPKVMTVAAESTHHAGGPSSNFYEPTTATAASKNIQLSGIALPRVAGAWNGLAQGFGLPTSSELQASLARAASNAEPETTGRRNLSEDEKTGAWLLAGIVATGWLAGAVFAPKKKKKQQQQQQQH